MYPVCCACVYVSRCVYVCITRERASITPVAVVDSNRPHVSLQCLSFSISLSLSLNFSISLFHLLNANRFASSSLSSPSSCSSTVDINESEGFFSLHLFRILLPPRWPRWPTEFGWSACARRLLPILLLILFSGARYNRRQVQHLNTTAQRE